MKRRRLRAGLLAGLFVLMLTSSCETLRSVLREPKVSVSSVDFAGISFSGVDMVCRLNVENPNVFDIPFPEVDWQLFINSASFINGTLANDSSLKGRASVIVDVPFSVTYSELFDSIASVLDTKEAAYRIDLGVRFPIPLLEEKTFHLDHSGSIPLPQAPAVSVASVKLGKIDFTGVEQDWEFAVDNPNAFAIPFPAMDWEYEVNGVPLIKGSLAAGGKIPAGAEGSAVIKVGVLYEDIFRALGSLAGSEADSLMKLNSPLPSGFPVNSAANLEIPEKLPIFRKPELSFRGLTIKNMGFQSVDVSAVWEIDNPNDFSLDISDFNYNLSVNNSVWAKGTLEQAPRIGARAKTVMPLDFSISAVSAIQEIINAINRGTGVNFASSGNFSVAGGALGLEKAELPFDLSGITRLIR